MAMTLAEMREEMLRKPDAQLLLEWIAMWGVEMQEVQDLINVYLGAWDEESCEVDEYGPRDGYPYGLSEEEVHPERFQ